jgi:hypothetical protein
MKTKSVILFMACLAMGLCLAGEAFAYSTYLSRFEAKYRAGATVIDTCLLCHVRSQGSGPRNAFGEDFANPSIGSHSFNAVLEARDSDGDGFANIVEINARTFPGDPASHPATAPSIPVPTSQQVFPAFLTQVPAASTDPGLSKPIGIGSRAGGGPTVDLAVNTGIFSGEVDVYLGIYASVLGPDIYLVTPGGVQMLGQAGLVPWQVNVRNASIDFGPLPVWTLPPGTYTVYLLATPPGSLNSFYLWYSTFTI